jgi:hypothetical protein
VLRVLCPEPSCKKKKIIKRFTQSIKKAPKPIVTSLNSSSYFIAQSLFSYVRLGMKAGTACGPDETSHLAGFYV